MPTIRSGAQREKDPRVKRRVDRARDRSIGSIVGEIAKVSSYISSTGKTPFEHEAKDTWLSFDSIDWSIDLARRRVQIFDICLPREREREKYRKSGRIRGNGNARCSVRVIDRPKTDRSRDGCSRERSPTRFHPGIDRSVYYHTWWLILWVT